VSSLVVDDSVETTPGSFREQGRQRGEKLVLHEDGG